MTDISPTSTSFFSAPSTTLDPHLFDRYEHLYAPIRYDILDMIWTFLGKRYNAATCWTHAWLAGSGISYQWEAARSPGDLDCLVAIDYPIFRAANPKMTGLSDAEITAQINEEFRTKLWKEDWHGWELTFYVNPAADIRSIKPYAAYDLTNGGWVVHPEPNAVSRNAEWDLAAQRDTDLAHTIVQRYSAALTTVQAATNPAARRNAEEQLRASVRAGADLFNEIHEGRHTSFSPIGEGYAGWGNYRWQAGKASGIIGALRQIKEYHDALDKATEVQTYGVELPDVRTLIRRAATWRHAR